MSSLASDDSPVPATATQETNWFSEHVQPHGSSLLTYLRARFPWLTDAEDIVQESLFRMWRRRMRESHAELRSPKAVLFAIGRNAALDLARRRAVVEIKNVAEIEQLFVLDETADVSETVSTRQELEFLAEALRELPERCRQVLTLTKMYGFSHKEVAEQLRISEFTVRAQVAKGVRRCAEYMRHQGVERAGRGAR